MEQRIKDTIALIDRVLAGNVYKTWTAALSFLCFECEEYGFSMQLAYHSGWFAKPKEGNDNPHEMGEPYLDEDERGFTVEVGMTAFQNEDGTQAVYEKPSWAVHDGLRLLKARLEEQL